MIGTNELIIIALVVMVLFGASAIPKFARSLGQAKKEFDRGSKEGSAAGDGEKSA
jgi:sec-independent protein translocase protein TatA